MNCHKLKVSHSPKVFKLPPSAFRLWVILEHDPSLRQKAIKDLAAQINMAAETVRRAMPHVREAYDERPKVTGYLPLFIVDACISHKAAKVLAWMWVLANEGASNRVYVTNRDIAEATAMSEESVAIARKELVGRFLDAEILTQRHRYLIPNPSQRMLNALAVHDSVTQFTLLNPLTGQPVKEERIEQVGFGVQLTNRVLSRFGFEPLLPLEDPGLRVMPNKDQLFIWCSGGWSLRGVGTRSNAERGKRQIGKGNIFALYQLLSGGTPEEADKAVRYLDGTKNLHIDTAAIDREVLGEPAVIGGS
jgi:hypothetical protein